MKAVLHYELTGNPFTVETDTIAVIWPGMGLDTAEINKTDGDLVFILEDLDQTEEVLKCSGARFVRLHYNEYSWGNCLINIDSIKMIESREEVTRVQYGDFSDDYIEVDMPLEACLNHIVAAM